MKVRCNKNFDNDVWHLNIGEVYNCDIKDGDIYIIYESVIMGNNRSILNITYSKEEFSKRFTDICEERRLKLKKIDVQSGR